MSGCTPAFQTSEPLIKPVPGALSEQRCEAIYELAARDEIESLLKQLDSINALDAVCFPANFGLLYKAMAHAGPESAVALAEKYGVNTVVTAGISTLASDTPERYRMSLFSAAKSVLHVTEGVVSDGSKYPSFKDSQLKYVDSANPSLPVLRLINLAVENNELGPNEQGISIADEFASCPIWWGCDVYLGLDRWQQVMIALIDAEASLTAYGQSMLLQVCKKPPVGKSGISANRKQACDNVISHYLSQAGADTFEPRFVSGLIQNDAREVFDLVLNTGYSAFDEEMQPVNDKDTLLFRTVRQAAAAAKTDYFTMRIKEIKRRTTGLSEEEFIKLTRSSVSDSVLRGLLTTKGFRFDLDVETILRLSKEVDDKYIEMLQETK